jgi:hypothetical protein
MTTHDDKKKKLSETAVFRDMPVDMLDEISGVVEDRVVPARGFQKGRPWRQFLGNPIR